MCIGNSTKEFFLGTYSYSYDSLHNNIFFSGKDKAEIVAFQLKFTLDYQHNNRMLLRFPSFFFHHVLTYETKCLDYKSTLFFNIDFFSATHCTPHLIR